MEIKDLEAKIDELIDLCDALEQNNISLLADRETWAQEKTRLIEKNDLARSKIEAMISRLKHLDEGLGTVAND